MVCGACGRKYRAMTAVPGQRRRYTLTRQKRKVPVIEPKQAVTVQPQPDGGNAVPPDTTVYDHSSGVPLVTIETGNPPGPDMTNTLPQPEPITVVSTPGDKEL